MCATSLTLAVSVAWVDTGARGALEIRAAVIIISTLGFFAFFIFATNVWISRHAVHTLTIHRFPNTCLVNSTLSVIGTQAHTTTQIFTFTVETSFTVIALEIVKTLWFVELYTINVRITGKSLRTRADRRPVDHFTNSPSTTRSSQFAQVRASTFVTRKITRTIVVQRTTGHIASFCF